MGIYSDGNVYGISWKLYDEYHKDILIQYEKKFTEKITIDNSDSEVIANQKRLQIKEIKDEFDKIPEDQRYECCIQFYTCVTDTYGSIGSYMTWLPGNKKSLELFFEKGDILI